MWKYKRLALINLSRMPHNEDYVWCRRPREQRIELASGSTKSTVVPYLIESNLSNCTFAHIDDIFSVMVEYPLTWVTKEG